MRGARVRRKLSGVVERIGVRLIHLLDHCNVKNSRIGQRCTGTRVDFCGGTGIKLREFPLRTKGAIIQGALRRLRAFQHQSGQRA